MARATGLQSVGRILGEDSPRAAIERRRKAAMNVLLGEFEKEIVPLIPPGHQEVIDQFKRLAREKINGVAYEGVRATEREPGDSVSRQTTDLAERLAFQDQEDVNP